MMDVHVSFAGRQSPVKLWIKKTGNICSFPWKFLQSKIARTQGRPSRATRVPNVPGEGHSPVYHFILEFRIVHIGIKLRESRNMIFLNSRIIFSVRVPYTHRWRENACCTVQSVSDRNDDKHTGM